MKGNAYVLEAGKSHVEGKVIGTGTWDDYQRLKIGEIDLPAGPSRVEFRPEGPIRGALLDLRRVEFRPLK